MTRRIDPINFGTNVLERMPELPSLIGNMKTLDGSFLRGDEGVAVIDDTRFQSFSQRMAGDLAQLRYSLERVGAHHVVLEGAHIYGQETPGERHYLEMENAGLLSSWLDSQGYQVNNALLIDDFHSDGRVAFDPAEYVKEAARRGWSVDRVFFEGEMASIAEAVVDTIRKTRGVIEEGDTVSFKRVNLRGVNGHKTPRLSCAVLDAGFSLAKLTTADAVINVLTPDLRSQQRNMRRLVAAALGEDVLPIMNLYVSLEPNEEKPCRTGSHGELR